MRKADVAIRKEKRRMVSMLDNLEIDKVKIPQELIEAAKTRQLVEPQETEETVQNAQQANSINEEMMSALGM